MGKGKKRMSEVIDLTSTFTNMSFDISGFMSGMNSHLETIASAFITTHQHEQVIMVRELHLDQKQKELDGKKKGLYNEVIRIPKLTRVEATKAMKKLVSDKSSLTTFYECPVMIGRRILSLILFIQTCLHPTRANMSVLLQIMFMLLLDGTCGRHFVIF